MKMEKTRKNSRNTSNPYELIEEIQLVSKRNRRLRLLVRASEFCIDRKNNLIATKFIAFGNFKSKNKHESTIIDLFNRIISFVNTNNNPMEIMALCLDVYDLNNKTLDIKFKTVRTYRDMLDLKFVNRELIDRD